MLRRITSSTSLQTHSAGRYHKELVISNEDSGESNYTYMESDNRRSSDSGLDDEEVSSVSLSDLSLEDNRQGRRQESSTPPTPSCMAYSSHTSVCNATPIEFSPICHDEIMATPPTPFVESRQDEYLQFIEPSPVLPPNYNLLPPGGCPKFPILSPIDTVENDTLPPYTPTVYKIGVVCRKIEWLSPYEPSPVRSWKNIIIELNSTQLNFYAIPGPMENHVLSFRPSETPRERIFNDIEEEEIKSVNSGLTSSADLQFFKYTQRLGLISSQDDDSSNNSSSVALSSFSGKYRSKNKRLLRSYSLQYARFGLATDYKKKPNVLRVRIENEQLLLNFSTTQDLIDWHAAFCSGRDVSLDILQRELPRERTLPRRRRRRSRSRRNSQNNSLASRNDSFLNQINGSNSESSKLKDKVLRFKSKFLSRNKSVDLSKDKNSLASVSSASLQRTRSPSLPSFNISNFAAGEDDDDDDDEENLYRLSDYRGDQNNRSHANTLRYDDYEDDIQNLSDLHASDDEDDEEFDCNIEDFNENNENNNNGDGDEVNREIQGDRQRLPSMARRFTLPSSVSSSSNNSKWYPTLDKPQSQRKYYRNCLRCIKPLTAEDTWVNKSVVKPTTLSPISFLYLRNMKYATSSSSSSSLASLGSQVLSSSYSNTQSHRKRSLSLKDSAFNLPDIALTRLPNHFLKEYLVGSHGLIPKEV